MNLKKILVLGLTAIVGLSLAGCKSKQDSADVVFWHTMGKENIAVLDGIIAEFNKVHPDITIKHTNQGDYDDLKGKITTAIRGGNEPDIAYAYPDHVASYLTQGVVQELDSFINDKELGYTQEEIDDFIPGFWAEGKVYNSKGTTFSMPFSKSTEVMFYNKTAFDKNGWKVPTTWEEMWELCAKIKKAYPEVTPLGYDSEDNMFITLLEQHNIPYTTNDATGADKYLFNNQEAIDLMTEVQGYYKEGFFTTKALSEGEYTSIQFTSQKLMMTIGSTGGAKYNLPSVDENSGESTFEYAIAPIPQVGEEGNPAVIQQGPSIVMFNHGEVKNEKAWLFIKFITETEASAKYSISTGYSPVRFSSMETEEFKEFVLKDTIQSYALKVGTQQTDRFYTSPAFNGSSNARVQSGLIIQKICLSNMDVTQAFKEAFKELTQ